MDDYARIEHAIHYLSAHAVSQPKLSDVAQAVGLSEGHFQRLFTRWAGVSPKAFVQYLTAVHAKERLAAASNPSVFDVAQDVGLSGAGRLYDLLVKTEAMTPGEYKSAGLGLEISYGFHVTPFGLCLLALTGRGVCGLTFLQTAEKAQALEALKAQWPNAHFLPDEKVTESAVEMIFGAQPQAGVTSVSVLLKGTPFQLKVWEALLRIPAGHVMSYKGLATHIGIPKGSRAVGGALARNSIGFLIPCHRVITDVGTLGGFRWGLARKTAMLGWEGARQGATCDGSQ